MKSSQAACVDEIFLYTIQESRFIFIILTIAVVEDNRDTVLDLPLVRHTHSRIVGISAIQPLKLYMVPLSNGTTVWVDWDVEWL
jgi:hypothetical protein